MTILEAAKQVGICIPTSCHLPEISPSDSCRMCVVEIDGVTRPVTSCNTIVADGMIVKTDTPRLRAIRDEADEVSNLWIILSIVRFALQPGSSGEIQNLTYRLNIYGSDYPVEKRSLPVVRNGPLIEYNPNLSHNCLRRRRLCHEVIGASDWP